MRESEMRRRRPQPGGRPRPRRAAPPAMDRLERRSLLTAVLGADLTLTVTGTAAADAITLSAVNGSVRVVENGGAPADFPASSVRAIVVRGQAGDDAIAVGPGLIGAVLEGGPGRDRLTGGDGDDTFFSRDGEADVVVGGLGVDRVTSDSPDTVSEVEFVNPIQQSPDNRTQVVRVMVVSYDPLVPSEGNRPLHEVFDWMSPPALAARYQQAMEVNSGGAVRFDIVDWRNRNAIPVMEDGYQYTPDQYVANRRTNTGWHEGVPADFRKIVADEGIVDRVDSGAVDEVWLIGDHYFAIPGESWMAGPGAFFINGPVYGDIPTARPFAAMGFSYERPDTLTHNMGHRTEATMNRIYGGWNLRNPATNWDRFSANYTESNGPAGIGTAHFPANAEFDYDYGLDGNGADRTVVSTADDWLTYPNLTGATAPVSRTAWSKADREAQWEYFEWYYNHLPRAGGVNADGRQNNWWKYLYNFQNYTADGQALPARAQSLPADRFGLGGGSHRFRVAYSGATFISRASLGDADVRVAGPDGVERPARLVGVNAAEDGPYLVATYEVDAPGGSWVNSGPGAYTIRLVEGQVLDALGRAVAGGQVGAFRVRSADATPLQAGPDTALLLPFDGTAAGAAGEAPTAASGFTFEPGRVGQAARFARSGVLRYPASGNIDPRAGTVEFWLRPDVVSGAVQQGTFFEVGQPFNNGIKIQLDGANNVRVLQWGDDPTTPAVESAVERGVGVGAGRWAAGQWHHIVATWSGAARELAFYVDGTLAGVERNALVISAFATQHLAIGAAANGTDGMRGVIDEFRILNRALTPSEVAADYRAGIGYLGLQVDPPPAPAVGDVIPLRAKATLDDGTTAEVGPLAEWSSSDPGVLWIRADGTAVARRAGTVTLSARLDTRLATRTLSIADPGRPVATLGATPTLTAPGSAPYQFVVTYADDSALRAATLDGSDIRVVGPAGFHQFAGLVSVDAPGDGPTRRATYRVVPPGGVWTAAHNGSYTVELVGWQVGDLGGRWAAPAVLGRFTVDLAGGNRPPSLSVPATLSVPSGRLLAFAAAATDPETAAGGFRYELAGAPPGASIDPATGAFRWRPTKAQGPGTYTFTVRALDGASPPLADEESITVLVTAGRAADADYDGDGKTDMGVYGYGRYAVVLSNGGGLGQPFGGPADGHIVGDYDGDGRTDVGVYGYGRFAVSLSGGGFLSREFGGPQDRPVTGDYDGDGKTDVGVYGYGRYAIALSGGGFLNQAFGGPGDRPVVGDYDGDGKADIGVYGYGRFAVSLSGGGFLNRAFGGPEDRPVVGDYDGDGRTDVGVYGYGRFAVSLSGGGFLTREFGGPQDRPVTGDYDGDGKTDIGVYGYGRYALTLSNGGGVTLTYGGPLDEALLVAGPPRPPEVYLANAMALAGASPPPAPSLALLGAAGVVEAAPLRSLDLFDAALGSLAASAADPAPGRGNPAAGARPVNRPRRPAFVRVRPVDGPAALRAARSAGPEGLAGTRPLPPLETPRRIAATPRRRRPASPGATRRP